MDSRDRIALRRVEKAFFAAGLFALGVCSLYWAEMKVYQAVAGWRLDRAVNANAPRSGAITPAALGDEAMKPGAIIGRIELARLGMSAIVCEGTDEDVLMFSVGHVTGTSFPGEVGNVVLSGHRDSFFRSLRGVRGDDVIRIVTPEGPFFYKVESTEIVNPDHVAVLKPTTVPTLTLITCYPFNFVGSAPKRFIVRAREVAGTDAGQPPPRAAGGARADHRGVLLPPSTAAL